VAGSPSSRGTGSLGVAAHSFAGHGARHSRCCRRLRRVSIRNGRLFARSVTSTDRDSPLMACVMLSVHRLMVPNRHSRERGLRQPDDGTRVPPDCSFFYLIPTPFRSFVDLNFQCTFTRHPSVRRAHGRPRIMGRYQSRLGRLPSPLSLVVVTGAARRPWENLTCMAGRHVALAFGVWVAG